MNFFKAHDRTFPVTTLISFKKRIFMVLPHLWHTMPHSRIR